MLAGLAFLVGKVASCAAAALVFATYVVPGAVRPVALAVVAVATVLNVSGVRWTVRGTWVLVTVVVGVLLLACVTIAVRRAGHGGSPPGEAGQAHGQVLHAAALVFFAFAGYARIATLGEEVRDPARTIRRAIPIALGVVLVLYTAVAGACLWALGVAGLGRTDTPLAAAVDAVGAGWLVPVVRAGAAVATLSALLSVLAGVSRTTLAMARRGDLPRQLAAISRWSTPWRADLAAAVVVAALVLVLRPESAVGLSAGTVLVYYAVANASALRLRGDERRWPRWTAYLGLVGCLLLAGDLVATLWRAAFHGPPPGRTAVK